MKVMGSSPGKKHPLAEIQGKVVYIRSKVVGPFPRPCALAHAGAMCTRQPFIEDNSTTVMQLKLTNLLITKIIINIE
jgi:hypothetical protein